MTESKSSPYWVDTPAGMLTQEGKRYFTSEKDLAVFAPQVVERVGVGELLRMATAWSRIPTALALLTLLGLLPVWSVWQALAMSVGVWFFLAVVSPSVVFAALCRPARWLGHPVLQGLLFVGVLSLLAAGGNLTGVWVGLMGFILFRWQLPERLLGRLVAVFRKPLSPLPPDDAILRNLTVRLALRYGFDVGGTEHMQQRVLEIMNRHRAPRKKG